MLWWIEPLARVHRQRQSLGVAICFLFALLGVKPAAADNGPVCDATPSCVTDLANIVDILSVGTGAFLAEAGALAAVRMDDAHDAAVKERGYGLYMGANLYKEHEDPTVVPHDCTTFLIEVLSQAFEAAGMSETFEAVMERAIEASGPDGLKGLELMKALQEEGWRGGYFNPDASFPADADDEHPYSHYLATEKGVYYGMEVDPSLVFTNYRPAALSDTERDDSVAEALKEIEFAVVAARGGKHMGVLVRGEVYEVSWNAAASSLSVVSHERLVDWDWLSGGLLLPPGTGPGLNDTDDGDDRDEEEQD